ncbi:hypothetical protein [Aliiroseovarius sp. 2305UL8-7]|uniref:hypothetical protein n=1 Tax=Aliiroseovarius conchicola TaxID=3121637 RepID=UPI00352871B7
MHPRTMIISAVLPFAVAACAQVPDFDAGAAANAPHPEIISMNEIMATPPVAGAPEDIAALAARAAQLRARAAAMRATPVVDTAAEADLQDALDQS